MAVTTCVCFKKTFAQLLPLARAKGWTTVAEISRATGCGTGCGGCKPYLAAMLATSHVCYRVKMDAAPPEPCAPDPWDS